MAVMDIQVSPRRDGDISVSDAVAAAHRVIRASGFKHVLHPMGTCIEADPSALYRLAADIHKELVEQGYSRIGVHIKIDDRRDKHQSMDDKLKSVKAKLEKEPG